MKISKLTRAIIITLIVIFNVGCDQVSKEIVRDKIVENDVISIITSNFILTKVENTGAALSMGENLPPILKIIVLQAMPILLLLFLYRLIIISAKISNTSAVALAFVIGGGIGNIYDRVLFGSVTDFMFINLGVFQTGIFNMADVSVVVGTLLILMEFLFIKKETSS